MKDEETGRPAPRLHVLIARKAARAVVLLRGPAKVARAAVWDLSTDVVSEGPPIEARVYERKADLSPDGRWLVYAAFGRGRELPEYGSGYTVIAEPPRLTARVFISSDTTYFGGGVFRPDGALALRLQAQPEEKRRIAATGVKLAKWETLDAPAPSDRERGFDNIHWRLLRDGWREEGGVYRRPCPGGELEKRFDATTETHAAPGGLGADWEWADVWRGEILFASGGGVFRIGRDGRPREIARFAPSPKRPRVQSTSS